MLPRLMIVAIVASACGRGTKGPVGPVAVRAAEHARYGETKELEALISRGELAVDDADGEGVTLLMRAAAGGQRVAVGVLLSRGATLERTDRSGRTALLHACTAGKGSVVSTLLLFGANPAATTPDGRDCRAWADPTRSKESQNPAPMTAAVLAALSTEALPEAGRATMLRQAATTPKEPHPDADTRAWTPSGEREKLAYSAIAAFGVSRDNVRSGTSYAGYVYRKPTPGEPFSRFHLDVELSDFTFSRDGASAAVRTGVQVWRGLTVGVEFSQYTAYREGATTGLAADELTSGGFGVLLGWIPIHSNRFLVHATALAGTSRAGQNGGQETKFGGRFGVGLFGVVRLWQWTPNSGTSLHVRAGYSSYSATPVAATGGIDASFSQRTFSVGFNPFELSF